MFVCCSHTLNTWSAIERLQPEEFPLSERERGFRVVRFPRVKIISQLHESTVRSPLEGRLLPESSIQLKALLHQSVVLLTS